jgi:serine/threonine-protein kinase HipA
MILQNTSLVHVFVTIFAEKHLMGRLAIKDKKFFFEYDSQFLKNKLELSPFKLPAKSGIIRSNDYIFEGLFGVFNDSLPDGWGRLLLDRKLIKSGFNPHSISPLDRLCFVGDRGMGALTYEPQNTSVSLFENKSLDVIAEAIIDFQENDSDTFVDDLLNLGGSSAGVRPKILVRIKDSDWIIKFRSSIDPVDIGNIEYAYNLMAQEAKLDVPEAQFFPSINGGGYFGTKRFDRFNGKPIHMHTVSGLLHTDHRVPSLDYEDIMKLTLFLTKDIRQCEKQFRAAVFNILSHNRDDHAKNFSFLMSEHGMWIVSPAYDLTFSTGPSGEHCTTVVGEGKKPQLSHLLKLATVSEIKKAKALEIINEVASAVSKWVLYADQAKVGNVSKNMIDIAIKNNLNFTY